MKRYNVIFLTVIVSFLFSRSVFAADIGIVRTDKNNLTTLNSIGHIINSGISLEGVEENLLLATGHKASFFTIQNTDSINWGGDFLTNNVGLEYLKTTAHRVQIYDQADTKIDTFSVSTVSADRVITVGDVFPNISGQEVVVCRISSHAAKVQVFSYNESTGEATEELSFHPFPDLIAQGEKNGCSDIAVADIAGEPKIVVTSSTQILAEAELFVYDTQGSLESTINLGFQGDFGYNDFVVHLDALDFDGDGFKNEVAVYKDPELKIVNISTQKITSIINLDYSHASYAIGNIDDDAQDEIAVLYGKKSNFSIWNGDEKTDLGALYPNAELYRYRLIVVADLSSLTD